MQIRLASTLDLEALSHLLNQYRHHLGQEKDYQACRSFLKSRLAENDSIIFVAISNETMLGFIQLYPSFSSVHLKPVWHLDDAYVVDEYRQQGVLKNMVAKAKMLADGTEVIFENEHSPKRETELIA